MRVLTVAAAQLGAIQKANTRESVVARMLVLMDRAKEEGAEFIVYPELALTTFFPRWYAESTAEFDYWFETEMPGAATKPLFDRAAKYSMAFSFGYAERTPDGHHFNTSILINKGGGIVGKYRKIHLPGHRDFESDRAFQHLEKRYFEPGDLGFPVWRAFGGVVGMCICNDRRWPETYRMLSLQGAEMITLGFNTPSLNGLSADEGPDKRMFHHKLSLQAGAYQNSVWVVAVAKAGTEDGHHLMGGTMIVNPAGEIVAEIDSEDDAVVVHACDLDETTFGRKSVFDFARHRRIEHYGLIGTQTGIIPPTE
jgi:predicted amidohydrolase